MLVRREAGTLASFDEFERGDGRLRVTLLQDWQQLVFQIAAELLQNGAIGHRNFQHSVAKFSDKRFARDSFTRHLFPDLIQFTA